MKFTVIFTLVIMIISAVNWDVKKTINLGGDGPQNMKLNYLDYPGSAYYLIITSLNLNEIRLLV